MLKEVKSVYHNKMVKEFHLVKDRVGDVKAYYCIIQVDKDIRATI